MRIALVSIFVDDQDNAEKAYSQVLGYGSKRTWRVPTNAG
jgi:hypothetical protein